MLTNKQRFYAIFKCLYFGVIPSFIYERECHFSEGGKIDFKNYWQHLAMNLILIKCLVLKTEHDSTHDFHKMKVNKWLRWQYKK